MSVEGLSYSENKLDIQNPFVSHGMFQVSFGVVMCSLLVIYSITSYSKTNALFSIEWSIVQSNPTALIGTALFLIVCSRIDLWDVCGQCVHSSNRECPLPAGGVVSLAKAVKFKMVSGNHETMY